MKAHLIPFIAGILLCFSSCGTAETATDTGSVPSSPLTAIGSGTIEPEIEIPSPATADSSSDTEQPLPENSVIVSSGGRESWEFLNDPAADPEEMVKILWYRANSLYDIGNSITMIDAINHPDTGVLYEKFYNYSGVIENTFTGNEREKYEASGMVYIAPDSNYYRTAPWATTYAYRDCLVSLELKSEADGSYTCKMEFPDFYANESDNWVKEFSELEQTYMDMTIVFENDKWLVDSFTDPRLA